MTYDDYDLIVQNQDFLSQTSNLIRAFTAQVFEGHHSESVYYRPVLMAGFIVEHLLWDLNPLGYHLMNILFHAATAIVIFLLAEKLTQSAAVGLTASLLFALHPVQVESVAWVAGGNDVLLGFFVCLMIYFHIDSGPDSSHPRRSFALSVFFFAAALFTKESAAFYLLLIPLYDLSIRRGEEPSRGSSRSVRKYAALAAVLAVYLLIRYSIFGEFVGAERLYGNKQLLQRLQEAPAVIAEYFLLILAPFRLSIAHPLNQLRWIQPPWIWIACVLVLGFLLLIRWSWRRDRIASFGLLWFAVGLLPTLNIIPVAVPILEHRMYLPMAGLALAVSRAAFAALGERSRLISSKAVIAIPLVVLSAVSYLRIPVWQNSESLWLDAIEKAPAYSRSYFNLAGYYFNLQRYDDAIRLLNTYVQIRPDEFLGYSKLRQTYYLAGRYGDALRVCREMIARSPRDPNRYIETAELFETLKMPDSAIAVCREGLASDSSLYTVHEHLGSIYARIDSLDESEREYRRSLSLNPQYASAYFALGAVQAKRHDLQSAIRAIELGIRFGTPSKDIVQLLANLYSETGQEEKARVLKEYYSL